MKSSASSHLIRPVHKHFLQVTRFLPVSNLTTRSKMLDRVRAMLNDPQRQQIIELLLYRLLPSSCRARSSLREMIRANR